MGGTKKAERFKGKGFGRHKLGMMKLIRALTWLVWGLALSYKVIQVDESTF